LIELSKKPSQNSLANPCIHAGFFYMVEVSKKHYFFGRMALWHQIGVPGAMGAKFTASSKWLFINGLS
jgi:hypothetical protein